MKNGVTDGTTRDTPNDTSGVMASVPVRYLLDANILLRRSDSASAHHVVVINALQSLAQNGALLCLSPQSLYEFWVVATRPAANNGLGLTTVQTGALIDSFKSSFDLRPDTPDVYTQWERLVKSYAVQGRNAHDVRLVAFMMAHGFTHLLTFNGADFRRFETSEQITIVDPAVVPPSTHSAAK